MADGFTRRDTVALAFTGLATARSAAAHNNPSFREEAFLTLAIAPAPAGTAAFTKPFALTPPKRTIELLWRVAGPAEARFTLTQGPTVVAEGLADGVRTKLLRGEGFVITQAQAAPFTIEVVASIAEFGQG